MPMSAYSGVHYINTGMLIAQRRSRQGRWGNMRTLEIYNSREREKKKRGGPASQQQQHTHPPTKPTKTKNKERERTNTPPLPHTHTQREGDKGGKRNTHQPQAPEKGRRKKEPPKANLKELTQHGPGLCAWDLSPVATSPQLLCPLLHISGVGAL